MQNFTRVLLAMLLLPCLNVSWGQTTVSYESFPNSFNTGFTRPINSSFTGSSGTWDAYSNDSYSTIVVNSAYHQSSPNALKLVNCKTSGCANTSYCKATSPSVNCNSGCVSSVSLNFKLYTYCISQSNTYFTFYVDVSKDNGATWTTLFQKTAKELYNTYGLNTWSTISVAIPSSFYNSSFKYKFKGLQNPGCNYNNYLYIDDACIVSQPCPVANLRLGNLIWNDINANGIKDANEPGVPGATVKVYVDANNDDAADNNTPLQTTTTNSNGIYTFSNLAANNYIVGVIIPSGYTKGPASTIDPGNNVDNDNNGVFLIGANQAGSEVRSKAITLSAGAEPTNDGDDANGNLTLDIPLCGNSQIGDFVWKDLNANGIQDSNEPGIAGATVTLTYPGGITASKTTDANGKYIFSALGPGAYTVTFTTPSGYTASPSNIGSNDAIDSDPVNGSVSVTITSGTINLTVDAGYYIKQNCTSSISTCFNSTCIATGKYIWFNASVKLSGKASSPTTLTIDNAVITVNVSGYTYTIPVPRTLIVYSSSVTTSTTSFDAASQTWNVQVPYNTTGSVFAGAVAVQVPSPGAPGSINPVKWEATFTGNTSGLSAQWQWGAAIYSSFNTDYNTLGVATVDGTYPAGTPVNYRNNVIGGGTGNGGTNYTGTKTSCATVVPCSGNTPLVSLGNQVWNDFDGDGKRDPSEPAIGNITVSLYNDNDGNNLPDGAAIRTTVTDIYGHYLFTNLPEGKYITSIPIIAGFTPSPSTTTQETSPFPNNNVDNDNNAVNILNGIVYTNAITLSAGEEPTDDGDGASSNLTMDMALCGNSYIGDFVWNDLNANGIQDAGEPGINDAVVTITFEDGRTATTTTHFYNNDGYYDFKNLGGGTYKITFTTPAGFTASPANQGGDDTKDSDPVNGGPVTVVIAPNQSDFTIDAGFYEKGNLKLGNQVWNDYDGDGKRDPSEPGIGNVTVSLYTDNNQDNLPDGPAIRTTVSDVYGHYMFTDLKEGEYIVSIPVITGYTPSPSTTTQESSPNPNNDVDNDNNGVNVVNNVVYSNAITLSEGDEPTADGDDANSNLTLDMALCGNAFIGDFVWNDLNSNGIQDAGEPGINDADVNITFADGTTATTSTHLYNGTDGYYDFKNLGPGTYVISFETPAGLVPSPSNAGSDDTKDSDPVNGSVSVTLAANVSNFTIDAGFIRYVAPANLCLGNRVWKDANDDGIRQYNESGAGGLTVHLYTDNDSNDVADGAPIATTTTNSCGIYGFCNLPNGKYIVGVVLANGYQQSVNGQFNPDNNINNDNNGVRIVNGEYQSNYITLMAGTEPTNDGDGSNSNLTLDFAVRQPSSCNTHSSCQNNCTHTGCGHSNCGHNSCKNNCTHTGCGHSNCGHNSCHNNCTHTGCGHSNCGHNSCHNNCTHTGCGHSNCGHSSYYSRYVNPQILTSIREASASVYPNPANTSFTINVNAMVAGIAEIRITSIDGRVAMMQTAKVIAGSNNIEINDLSKMKSGAYTVQVLLNHKTYTQRLVVAK